MSRITSKYQVSIPKALADRAGVRPGDDLEWRLAGRELRASVEATRARPTIEQRLKMFDEATRRQSSRNRRTRSDAATTRGWTREELYNRGRTR